MIKRAKNKRTLVFIIMIFIFNTQISCSNFQKSFVNSPSSFWNIGNNDHALYSKNRRNLEQARYDSIRNLTNDIDQRAKERGWDKIPEHPTDYWFNLDLHR